MNLRALGPHAVGIALDETTTNDEIEKLMSLFRGTHVRDFADDDLDEGVFGIPQFAVRTSQFLTHPVFNTHHTETEMLRYLRRLESRDLSLCHSMIPLGSCTMKLNATAEMLPISWPEFARLHPFAPADQTFVYREMAEQLEYWLGEITGFAAVSLQPNAGSQGEYAGLLAIRGYHASRGEGRNPPTAQIRRARSWQGLKLSRLPPCKTGTLISLICAPKLTRTLAIWQL